MPYLTDKSSILETLRSHSQKATRLWIMAGYERALDGIIMEAKKSGVSFRVIPKEEFSKRFKGVRGHILLERESFEYADPDALLDELSGLANAFFTAFDGIYDPQNLGNAIRSAAALSVDAIIVPKDRSCPVTEAVINVARGGLEHVKIARVTNLARYLEQIKRRNVFCFGLDQRGETNLWNVDLRGPVCLVFGSEEGMRRLTRESCDELVRIPTSSAFPTLNVANCFSMVSYEVVRQRSEMIANRLAE